MSESNTQSSVEARLAEQRASLERAREAARTDVRNGTWNR
jgi:hypothetical protein